MPDVLAETAGRLFVKLAVEPEPNRDIYAADQRQQTPPPSQGI